MNLYAINIGTVIVVAADSPAEASRMASHYAEQNKHGRDWECGEPIECNALSLPSTWSERDRVVGPHAMTVGDVLAEAA